VDRTSRPPAAVAAALSLPFPDGTFDVVIAAFALNHLRDPVAGAREAGRVASDLVLASTYADDDEHPVKAAAEQALLEAGWTRPAWYDAAKAAMAAWGSVEQASRVVADAGLVAERVEHTRVTFPELTAADLVA
jgi:hypothetical protein